MIILAKEKRNKNELNREEFGVELGPDDLDLREENDLTEEQMKNSHKAKQQSENTSKKGN